MFYRCVLVLLNAPGCSSTCKKHKHYINIIISSFQMHQESKDMVRNRHAHSVKKGKKKSSPRTESYHRIIKFLSLLQ